MAYANDLYNQISGLGDTIGLLRQSHEAPDLMREYQSALSGKPMPAPAEEPGIFSRILKGENPFASHPPSTSSGQAPQQLPSITPMSGNAGGHESYLRQAAAQRGIDPDTAVRAARSEGLGGAYAGDQGSSFGDLQLHYGGVAPGGNSGPGLGDEFTKQTGLDARNPETWKQQIDFAMDNVAKGGWGPFHGAKRVGIGEFQGIGGNGRPSTWFGKSSPSGQAVQLAGPPPMPDTAPVNVQPGQAAPSGVPSIGSGAAQTPMGQAMPGMSEELLMRMMRNPYTAQIAQAHLQQQMRQQYREPPTSVQEYEYGLAHPDFEKFRMRDSGANKFGLTPVWGMKNGKPVLLQLSGAGGAQETALPEGVDLSSGVDKIDLGTEWGVLDKKSGQMIGRIPKDVAGKERAEELGKAAGKAEFDLPRVAQNAEQTLKTIEQIRNHPGIDSGTGWGGFAAQKIGSVPGTHQRAFTALVNQAKGKAFLEAYNTLKGGGQITEIEGTKATDALARMDTAQSKEDFLGALGDFEDVVKTGLARAKGQAGAPSRGREDILPAGKETVVNGYKIRRRE